MERLKGGIKHLLTSKKTMLVLFVAILFIIVAIYVYRRSIKPGMNPKYVANKEYLHGESKDGGTVRPDAEKTADLMFFYTTWCPHCKNAKPEWDKFKKKIGPNKVNGYKINFLEIDCEKNEEEATKYKVEGYPTIKLVKDNTIIEYDAKPSYDTLTQFLNQFTKG